MAVTGKLKYKEEERASWFSHKAEEAKPYHYKVYLADYDVSAEVTPTERAAMFRFTFPKIDSSYILIDAFNKGSMVKIIPEQKKIVGYVRNNNGGVPENFHSYFVAVFDKDFKWKHTWSDNWKLNENSTDSEGDHVGAIIGFETELREQVNVKVASSFISFEQAELNLNKEIGENPFKDVKLQAMSSWENEFQRLLVEDDNIDNIRTFYSWLYRLLLFPRKFYEINKEEEIVHYSPYNGKVLHGYMFTDNGFWDTFRAVFPFFNLMYPELNKQIMEGLANTYKESGWLPEWASPGHRDVMIGSNSASIISDAYLKGNVNKKDEEVLLEGVIRGISEAAGELAEPFVSEAIYTEALTDLTLRGGVTQDGRRLYTDQTPLGDKIKIGTDHLAEALMPFSYPQLTRLYQAALEKPSERGEFFELPDELLGFAGYRAVRLDPVRAMGFKIAGYQKGIREARGLFTGGGLGDSLLKGGPKTPMEVIEAYIKSTEAKFNVQKDMLKKNMLVFFLEIFQIHHRRY